MFLDRENPNPRHGVYVILANEPVRSFDQFRAPDPESAPRLAAGFCVLDLPNLVAMKLQVNRRRDQVHIEDMLELGLIDAQVAATIPSELLPRLREIRDTMEWHTPPPVF